MLPPVINEGDFFPFKFWFNDRIQDGMYFRSELFYRLYTAEIEHRAKLYHYACRLAQDENVVVTATDAFCSIWLSLRGSGATVLRNAHSNRLPPFLEAMQQDGAIQDDGEMGS